MRECQHLRLICRTQRKAPSQPDGTALLYSTGTERAGSWGRMFCSSSKGAAGPVRKLEMLNIELLSNAGRRTMPSLWRGKCSPEVVRLAGAELAKRSWKRPLRGRSDSLTS